MNRRGRLKIAVLGSASVDEHSPEGRKAFIIGREIASRQGVLLTGACPGLPHAAVQGAHSARGLTIGVSPAMNMEDHHTVYSYPVDSDVILFTGMGTKGRNVVLIRSADGCIFIGGGMGTLNEFTIAFDDLNWRCAIAILSRSGGLSDDFLRLWSLVGKSPQASLVADPEPERLVATLMGLLRT